MPYKQNTVLAVIAGRYRLGVAVFRGTENLMYYRGKSLKQYRTENLLVKATRKFLKETFARNRITHLAMHKLQKSQKNSPLLAAIVREIKLAARKNKIAFCEYDAVSIRRKFCDTEEQRATREVVAGKLAQKYPELARLRQRTRGWERKYYGYVFDAIACAEVCAAELRKAN